MHYHSLPWCLVKHQFRRMRPLFKSVPYSHEDVTDISAHPYFQKQACSETFQRLHSLGNWAMFPEITTFSFKYVSYLAFSLAFGLKSAINYKSNIAELPANKNQDFSN